MKKIFYAAAILIGFVSCSKEKAGTEINTENQLLFTAEIVNSGDESAEGTKTQIDIVNTGTAKIGKVSWTFNETEQDIITVKDKDKIAAQYKVIALGEDGRATFAPLDDKQPTLGDGPYTATYGDIDNQVYNSQHIGSNCPMTAVSGEVVDGLVNLSFHNTAAVVSIKVKSEGAVLKRIVAAVKTLNISPFINISNETTFDVAIPSGDYENGVNIDFIAVNGILQSKSTKALELKVNQIHQVKVTSGLDFEMEPLDGEFSVSETEKVRFAPGNVKYDLELNEYAFEKEQHYFHTIESTGGTYYNVYDENGKQRHCANLRGLFKWPQTSEDKDLLKEMFIGWDLMTNFHQDSDNKGEWYYLTKTRNTVCENKAALNDARFTPIVITDNKEKIAGCLLFPDSFVWPEDVELPNLEYINFDEKVGTWESRTAYSSNDFKKLEAAGMVFLPAAGRWNGNISAVEVCNFENSWTGEFRAQYAAGFYLTNLDRSDAYFKFTHCQVVLDEDSGKYGMAIRFVVRSAK